MSAQDEKEIPQRTHPKKRDRVRYIAELMASGQWVTGVTVYDLADSWGIDPDTAKKDAAEASRRIREATGSDEEIRARILSTLETITERAMSKGQLRTAVESVKALAGVTGVEAPKKVDVGGSLAEFLALGLAPGGDESGGPMEK